MAPKNTSPQQRRRIDTAFFAVATLLFVALLVGMIAYLVRSQV